MCGSRVPDGFESCRAGFEEVCAREYLDPAFGAVHLLTVDAYALQHSEEHRPRSNAFHLMRLCALLERGGNPAIGQRPPRQVGKALEEDYRAFPTLAPPTDRGSQTVAEVRAAHDAKEHAERVRAWARSVWEAYRDHHQWARSAAAAAAGGAIPTTET
jgi:hypothetical protein